MQARDLANMLKRHTEEQQQAERVHQDALVRLNALYEALRYYCMRRP
jgi:uncharacterized protein YdeI (YjbR/CyaY-like superfamily)